MSGLNGEIRGRSPDGHGLWAGDTRVLSDYRLRLNGEEPVARASRIDAGSLHLEASAAGLDIVRERYVDDGLHERITLTNRGAAYVRAELELNVGADFVDMMAFRGMAPGLHAPSETREPAVTVRPPGTRHRVELRPGGKFTVVVDVLTSQDFDAGLARMHDAYHRWAADCAAFETDNRALNELLQRSRDDLRLLCDFYPTGIYPSAGIPWYVVPFGRDALFTALFTLPLNPEVARGTLRYLAAHQGVRLNPANEEQPGKILHEVRTGAAVGQDLWPHIFYGDVDAASLFVCLLAEALDWIGDQELVDQMWPAAEAALAWCETFGDADGDGYIECYTGRGRNQGWKDSDDSLTHIDGTDAGGHAALCEVQGYLYRALLMLARKRPALNARAAELKRRFNNDFWIAQERFVAQALDRTKKRVEAISSNPGHCLWSGILSAPISRAAAARLVSSDLFSGWGVRTLSSRAINYDPRNGANGCVVPFDSAIAAAGLRRTGFVDAAELVARAVLEAGMAFPHRRVPEFFCGFDRVADHAPEEHPNSCSPQAWSAAAPFSLLTTLLGLTVDSSQRRLRVAPCRTPLWKRLEVNGLHFAGHRIDFAIEEDRVKLGAIPRGVKIETS